jgi:DedD protein
VDEGAGEKVEQMANNARRGGGERVLESRHLVGLFLGVVLLCGVFFTLGYVMGRTQFGGSVHAADSLVRESRPTSPKPKEAEKPPAPAAGEWDFYGKEKKNDNLEAPQPATKSPASAANTSSKPVGPGSATPGKTTVPEARTTPVRFQPPALSKTAIVLQVAALRRQSDALEMAEAIQQKKFPSFVVTPGSDNLYRVQVGPYQDTAAAESAKRALEQFGFKPIIKR